MNEWQTAETAPTDKACIFFQPSRELFEGYNIGPFMAIGTWDGESFYPSSVSGFDWETYISKPTHWMVLPEGPSSKIKDSTQR